jgi:hypothetical protein
MRFRGQGGDLVHGYDFGVRACGDSACSLIAQIDVRTLLGLDGQHAKIGAASGTRALAFALAVLMAHHAGSSTACVSARAGRARAASSCTSHPAFDPA